MLFAYSAGLFVPLKSFVLMVFVFAVQLHSAST